MRDKTPRRMLRRYRKAEARIEQKEQWARLRKFKAPAKSVFRQQDQKRMRRR